MTPGDIITRFRRETEAATYHATRNLPQSESLWANSLLLSYIDEAQKEMAERTACIKDSLTYTPDITTDDAWIDYDPKILRIVKAELVSDDRELQVITAEEFATSTWKDDYGYRKSSSWQTDTGTPRYLISDIRTEYLRVYPIPTADDEINLTVHRYPINTIVASTTALEVPTEYHYGLIYFVQKEAYSSPLALAGGLTEAAGVAAAKWESFLEKMASRVKIRTRGPGATRYGGL